MSSLKKKKKKSGGTGWDKLKKYWNKKINPRENAPEREAADKLQEEIRAQEAALQAQYDAIVSAEGADSIAAQERKKQLELLKKRRRRSRTILTSPLGLTGEPTTTSPTLLGGS